MNEAAVRKAPLTVLTVNPVMATYWSGLPVTYAGDEQKVAEIRKRPSRPSQPPRSSAAQTSESR